MLLRKHGNKRRMRRRKKKVDFFTTCYSQEKTEEACGK